VSRKASLLEAQTTQDVSRKKSLLEASLLQVSRSLTQEIPQNLTYY
jgi:hypothetical protein